MTFDEYKTQTADAVYSDRTREETDIDCPKCSKKIFRRTDIVFASYPPQYVYECDCGWSGNWYA